MAHGLTIGRPASRSHHPRLLRGLARAFRTIVQGLFDPYRPELHYMRGPGPKWRAKHPGEVQRPTR